MKDPYKQIVSMLDAMGHYLRYRSAGIWQEIEGQQTPYIGTGTCVEIGGRLFILTAAHNFKDVPDGGSFTLFSANASSTTPLTIIDRNYGQYGNPSTLDVAWLEVDPASATRTNLDSISISAVDSYHNLLQRQNYQVAGLPFELRRSYREGDQEHFTIPFILYNTIPSDKQDGDLSLDYSEFAIAEEGRTKMPHPGGISGGGIWYFPLDVAPMIWSAADCRLAGIVTEYYHDSGRISGLRIHHWLKLLIADHPKLANHIRGF